LVELRARKDCRWNPQMKADAGAMGMVTAYLTGKEDGLLFLEDLVARCLKEREIAYAELELRVSRTKDKK
jgi:hypothetical protein